MVKEAVFSMIQFEVEGARVLDLFAGSGQMGIEALSRGARDCVFVDNSKAALQILTANLAQTGFSRAARVVRGDVLGYLQGAGGAFDIAFLDPPYGAGLGEKALPLVAQTMSESGVILIECAAKDTMPATAGAFAKYREYRYGKTKIVQYRHHSNGRETLGEN
jgi:16S rRNA (guanine(966)-N(2))-methyltransferase RsmD